MTLIKNFVMTLAAILFLNFGNCEAEDLKFIDSNGDVGYFIDMDSVQFESSSVFRINMAIIRLNLNQMEVVDLRINHAAKNYAILSTKTLSYDERTEIKSDNTARGAKSYSDKSLMGDIVEIVIYGGE
ncbi:MAG: hypothetical protein IJT73_02015 [Selenomonadaceae bacterium]|nr:hypothetical protein [Selenomonadaceae bacterium]